MADPEHLAILKQGVQAWNRWRQENPQVRPNLRKARLSGQDLRSVNFSDANLRRADLRGADLSQSYLRRADLRRANLSGGTLREADFTSAILIETDLQGAVLDGCYVYGVSAWNVKLDGAKQQNLIVGKIHEPVLTVDDLEVAQFIYLLLNNRKIRDVITTIGQKAVLILGRFTPRERKDVLDGIADKLRQLRFLPILFDFEKSQERDFTETIRILAGMSLFVIADITNPKSSPLELQATVPDYKIPFVTILQEGESPFSMFKDLTAYDWVLQPVITYKTGQSMIAGLEKAVIAPALRKHVELVNRRAEALKTKSVEDLMREIGEPS
jgi:hypothetical protein